VANSPKRERKGLYKSKNQEETYILFNLGLNQFSYLKKSFHTIVPLTHTSLLPNKGTLGLLINEISFSLICSH